MIYFIQDSGTLFIKIGYTANDADDRLKSLQTGNPSGLILLLTMEGEPKDEANLHEKFTSLRERGEWFRPAPAILQFIIQQLADCVWYWHNISNIHAAEAIASSDNCQAILDQLFEERSLRIEETVSRSIVDAVP